VRFPRSHRKESTVFSMHPLSRRLIHPAARLLPLAVLAVLAGAALPAAGQPVGGGDDGSWVSLNPPRAAGLSVRLTDVSCPNEITCFAVGDAGTILATNDGGTWQRQASHSTARLSAIDCPHEWTCMVVAGRSVLATSNGGGKWDHLPVRSPGLLHDVACATVRICVAVGESGTIVTTSDFGQIWHAVTPVTDQDLRGVSCPAPRTCFASGGQGIFLSSEDGGVTWRVRLDRRPPRNSRSVGGFGRLNCPSVIDCIVISTGLEAGSNLRYGVAITSDSGTTWTDTFIGIGHVGATSIDCPALGECFLTLPAPLDRIVETTDGGRTWEPQFAGLELAPEIEAISCPTSFDCIVVGANGTLGQTTLAGADWTLTPVPLGSLNAIVCPQAQDCYAVGEAGNLVVSHDGGASWQSQSVPRIAGPAERVSTSTVAFTGIDCTSPTECIAVGTDVSTDTTGSAVVFGTTDGGLSWSLLHRSEAGGLRAIDCPSTAACYAVGPGAGGRQILLSSHGGAMWSRQDVRGLTSLIDIDCPADDTCYAVGGVVAVTTDAGDTWRVLDLGLHGRFAVNPYAVTCPTALRCLVLARASDFRVRLIRTEDGGASWKDHTPPRTWVRDAGGIRCFSDLDCILIGDRMLTTADGGRTWHILAGSGPLAFGTVSGITCATPEACMASTFGGLILAWNHAPSLDLNGDLPGTDATATFTVGGSPVLVFEAGGLADPDPWQLLESVSIAIANPLDAPREQLSVDLSSQTGDRISLGISMSNQRGTLVLSGINTVANYQRVLSTLRYANTAADPDTLERVIKIVANDAALDSNIATSTVTIRQASPPELTLSGFTAAAEADGRVTLAWETTAEPKVAGFFVRRAREAGATAVPVHPAPIPAKGSATTGARYGFDDFPGVGRFRYWLEAVDAAGVRQVIAAANLRVGMGRAYLPHLGGR
jgi:photosystem II stability/assembly factor-like uncharacterized protein